MGWKMNKTTVYPLPKALGPRHCIGPERTKMKDIGVFRTYSISPDPKAPGDHITRITLVIKSGPGSLPDLARDCGDLVGEQVGINLTRLQSKVNLESREEMQP